MEEIVFPNQLRMLRRVRGRRMNELADLLKLSISALSKIEKGYRRLNATQIEKVSKFLDCPLEAIFVSETSSQPEVLKAWQEEQKARSNMNIGGGLKTLGAGLRYIRGQKKMTLNGVAKGAKLTLSVYHRIEMGQREVEERTFENIARALGMSNEDLQLKIYELDSTGALDELKKNVGRKGVSLFKGGYNDLPMSRLMMRVAEAHEISLPISGTLSTDGYLKMHRENPVGSVICPSTLANDPELYAVRTMGKVGQFPLPEGEVIVVSPTINCRENDWVFLEQEGSLCFGQVKKIDQESYQIFLFNNEKIVIAKRENLQRVVLVVLM